MLEFLVFYYFLHLAGDGAFHSHRRSLAGVELHVTRFLNDVVANEQHSITVAVCAQRVGGTFVGNHKAHFVAALEVLGNNAAVVDNVDFLGLCSGECHYQGRGNHQANHQHGKENCGDDEALLGYTLQKFACYYYTYL